MSSAHLPPSIDHADLAPGLRLRKAREAAGLTVTEVAERLRLRASLVDAMEREDQAALGAPVFARGYVSSYARLLGMPGELADAFYPREQVVTAAPLRSGTRISHGRFLVDRYARRLVYVALTASIVVPVVLLATRDHLPDPAALLSPLDGAIALQGESQGTAPVALSVPPSRSEEAGPPAPTEQAVMASLAPFYSAARQTPAPAPLAAQAPQGLVLQVSGDSWVEVIGHDGSRLVHDLLRAGTERQFDPDEVARVLLGNAGAVSVHMNGVEIDTAPYRKANVARFTVSSDGSLTPASGG